MLGNLNWMDNQMKKNVYINKKINQYFTESNKWFMSL